MNTAERERLAYNLRRFATELEEISDDVIGSLGDADESADCFKCALVKLRYLRQDIQAKASEIQRGEEPAAGSEAAE